MTQCRVVDSATQSIGVAGGSMCRLYEACNGEQGAMEGKRAWQWERKQGDQSWWWCAVDQGSLFLIGRDHGRRQSKLT